MTGGRIKRVQKYIENEDFMLTYGDGVANINIKDLVEYHKSNGKLLTVTSVQPSGRFGALDLSSENDVKSFVEKPKGDGLWINGGYMVCHPSVLDYIVEGDKSVWEQDPMQNIALKNEMKAYKHNGFWKPMDTLKDRNDLNNMWESGKAPWKTW